MTHMFAEKWKYLTGNSVQKSRHLCIPPIQPCPQTELSPDIKPADVNANSDDHQNVTCWGKIYAPTIFNSREDTILNCLNEKDTDLGLISVKRIIKGSKTPTSTLKLKFKRAESPEVIYIFDKPHKCEKLPW